MTRGAWMRHISRSKGNGNISIAPWIERAIRWTYGTSALARWEGRCSIFSQSAQGDHTQSPQVINVDHNAAYPNAVDTLKDEQMLPKSVELRQNKYLNNVIEQDHRNIKRIVKPMMGFKSFNTARKTLRGIEAMNRVRKGQVIWNRTRGQCVSSQVY
jgi:hypothetical protein